MLELLQAFNYIQRFYADGLQSLRVLLQFLLLFDRHKALLHHLLSSKQKAIPQAFYDSLEQAGLEPVFLQEKLNWKKVIKMLSAQPYLLGQLEEFLQTIALQKTILKLYDYVTPLEINQLVCGLLDIKDNQSVYHPCCGMGTWFLSLGQMNAHCIVYGEEIDPNLVQIAKILLQLAHIKTSFLQTTDILKEPSFIQDGQYLKFDKIFCHPPLLSRLLLGKLKNDERFREVGLSKGGSEIAFLTHLLDHFQSMCVFLVRTQLLYKQNLGERFKKYLLSKQLLKAIIQLPSNLFPKQSDDLSLLVLTPKNDRIFLIDARCFFVKKGKYNRLVNLDVILDSYLTKQNSPYARLLTYQEIDFNDLRPSAYILYESSKKSMQLADFLETCFRGQRVVASKDERMIGCYDVGIKEFAEYGFTNVFGEYHLRAASPKIEKLYLQPYDLLLPLRGLHPKFAIIGEEARQKRAIANAGILVLRFRNDALARAIYLYFLSKEGSQLLSLLYQNHNERICEQAIATIALPVGFVDGVDERFAKLLELSAKIKELRAEILDLLH